MVICVTRKTSRVQRPESSIQSPVSSVQRPESRVQHPKSSVQSPACRVQRTESSVQSPESNSCVQSPGIPVCLISIHFLFRDICVNMAHVSNRLKFDTFFTLILSFENGISNEWTSPPQKEKKVATCLTKTLSDDCAMIILKVNNI